MALIGYTRVSTESQYVDSQESALREASYERIFENIVSGVKKEWQDLDAALAYLREGDTLVMWKLDRLGHSMVHLVSTMQSLAVRGADLKALAGQGAVIDTTAAPGKLIFRIFTALAEFEYDLIRERIKVGLVAAAVRDRKGRYKPVVIVNKLQRVREHTADGLDVREAATRLKVSKTTLYAAL